MSTDALAIKANGHSRRRKQDGPPDDPETERLLLASLIALPETMDSEAIGALLPRHFFDADHRTLFRHLVGLHLAGLSPETLATKINSAGELDASVKATLRAVLKIGVSGADAVYYAGVIRDMAERRDLWSLAHKLREQIADGLPAADIRGFAAAALEAGPNVNGRAGGAILVNLADVTPRPIRWLWPGRIALGKLTIIAGEPGLGKSYLSLDLAARVSTGNPWPDNPNGWNEPGEVVLLSSEDDLGDTVRPRLDQAGADVKHIAALQGVEFCTAMGPKKKRCFNLQDDLPTLTAALAASGDCRLCIIDPISSYLGGIDSHKNADVRAVLAPLGELAAQHNVAIVAISHLNKSGGARAINRVTGSGAFVAASRAAWLVTADKDDDKGKRRLLLSIKNNLAEDVGGLAFAIVDNRLAWETDSVTVSANDALDEEKPRRGPDGEDRKAAEAFLREQLADGPKATKDLNDDARQVGISTRTLQRAARSIGVVTVKVDGKWVTRFP